MQYARIGQPFVLCRIETYQEVDAGARREQPLPDDTRDDETDRHGEQEDAAEDTLAADLAVEQIGQEQSDGQRHRDEHKREDDRVAQVQLEARVVEDRDEVVDPG